MQPCNGHWSQSPWFHLILGILLLVYQKSDKIHCCCFSANVIAIPCLAISYIYDDAIFPQKSFFGDSNFKLWLINMTCDCKENKLKDMYFTVLMCFVFPDDRNAWLHDVFESISNP